MSNPYASNGGYTISTAPSASTPAHAVKDTTTQGFATDVIQESRNQPVLVDFWAPWCGPCRQLAPALEKVVRESAGRVKLVKMNIDDHPSIAGQLGIQSIPAVIAFVNGQPVDGFMGALPESQIRAFIDRVAKGEAPPDVFAEALQAAADAAASGNRAAARELYEAILEQEADKLEAIVGLAGLLLDDKDADGARALIERLPEERKADASVTALLTRIELENQVAELGDFAEAEAKVIANPQDHQARFDLALMQNARNDRTAAADSLLTIIRLARDWNDGAARAQLLKFFEAWGQADPDTAAARRKLSSVLFS
ncbi:MAG: thioredoxin [Rhizobiaceae bacterium]